MNQENMTNEELRIKKLMEEQARKDSVEDRRIRRLMEEQAHNTNLEDLRIEKIMREQATTPSNEDIRIQKIMEEDAYSSLTHTGYTENADIYHEKKPAPVDNSLRVDQIDTQIGRADLSPVRSISPVRPVTAAVDPVNFADALEQWRYMSEKYRDARNNRLNNTVKQSPTAKNDEYLYNTNQFQKQYEKDSIDINHTEEKKEPPVDIAILMDQVQEKINYFQGNQNLEQIPQNQQNVQNVNSQNQIESLSHNYNENHNYINPKSTDENQPKSQSKPSPSNNSEDFRDRIISRLSTANLELSPELFDEHTHEGIEPQGDILKVSDVMTKNVISVIDSMTIEQVASIFNKKKIMGVPVIHYQTKQPVGMITMSDIVEHIFDEGLVTSFPIEGNMMSHQESLAILEKPVRDIMHTDIAQVDSETTIKDACKLMLDGDLHRIIITKNNRVNGIFTSFDAVRILAQFDVKVN